MPPSCWSLCCVKQDLHMSHFDSSASSHGKGKFSHDEGCCESPASRVVRTQSLGSRKCWRHKAMRKGCYNQGLCCCWLLYLFGFVCLFVLPCVKIFILAYGSRDWTHHLLLGDGNQNIMFGECTEAKPLTSRRPGSKKRGEAVLRQSMPFEDTPSVTLLLPLDCTS